MVMCLNARYQDKVVVGDKTLFLYQAYLRRVVGDDGIFVRVAANSKNEKGFGFMFPSTLNEKFFSCYKLLEEQAGVDVRWCDESAGSAAFGRSVE